MILQSIVFPDEICDESLIYFRTNGSIDKYKKQIFLREGQTLSTYTYMNVFDMGFWRKYTSISKIYLNIRAFGYGEIIVINKVGEKSSILKRFIIYDHSGTQKENSIYKYEIDLSEALEGLIFLYIRSYENFCFYDGHFKTTQVPGREVLIAVDTVTYHRNKELTYNLRNFLSSDFFDTDSCFYGKLMIHVVDNGDDFKSGYDHNFLKVHYNSNAGGGSGGFARGLEEIKKDFDQFPVTHTVFMDDDVQFQPEGFYRLYSFLSYVKDKYKDNPIAGRMFCLNRKNIQYTAAEIWNMGDLIHVEGNLDMTDPYNIKEEADVSGEYGGWWLSVYPAEFSLNNKPFPFFLHCDDAEYGLRCGRETLILRGFQVWHETYEKRISPSIIYYDARNSFLLNMMHEPEEKSGEVIAKWKQRMDGFHNERRYDLKYICAAALLHIDTLKVFKKNKGQIPDRFYRRSGKQLYVRIVTPLMHRVARIKAGKHYKRSRNKYLKILEFLCESC